MTQPHAAPPWRCALIVRVPLPVFPTACVEPTSSPAEPARLAIAGCETAAYPALPQPPKEFCSPASRPHPTGRPTMASGSVARAWCALTPGRPLHAPGREAGSSRAESPWAARRASTRPATQGTPAGALPASRAAGSSPAVAAALDTLGGGTACRLGAIPDAHSCLASVPVWPSPRGLSRWASNSHAPLPAPG
jgi:hypothetical protein